MHFDDNSRPRGLSGIGFDVSIMVLMKFRSNIGIKITGTLVVICMT